MRMPVRLTEFMPRWRDLEPEDRSTLGGGMMVLGREALAGGRVRTVADAFRVTVTAGSHREVIALLPGGGRHRLLEEALPAAMRPARLGSGSRLGWTGWLGSRSKTGSRADIRLGAGARTMTQSQRKEPA
jgi:predicted component of type VI protein secretion system